MMINRLSLSQQIAILLGLAFLAGTGLSWPLWYAAARPAFPVLPLLGTAGPEPVWLSFLSAAVLLEALLVVVVFHRRTWPLVVFLAAITGLCVLDLNRLQPWVWLYSLIVGTLLCRTSETETRHTLRWLLAGVYIWSGLHKCSPYFAVDNFAWFSAAFSWTKALGQYPVLGYVVAGFEMALGLGLLWPRSRRICRWLALLFHTLIVLMLSPLGLHWNTVVIPWNLALAALVWLVFQGAEAPFLPGHAGHRVVVLLAVLAPVLHFAGAWPDALSWKLYSNTQPEATFYNDSGLAETLPGAAVWQPYTFDHGTKLLLDDWANAELGVPLFAGEHTFRQAGAYLCGCTNPADSAGLYILTVQPWNRAGEQWRKIPCRELLGISK